MEAVVYRGAGKLEIEDRIAEAPGCGQVAIEVAYTGICGTDLHIYHGDMDARVGPAAVIGHEMSGRVAAIGHDVTGWSVGQPVTVMPTRSCGRCAACQRGDSHICHAMEFLGIDSPGAMQSIWNVPADLVLALPDSLPLHDAALVEPVAVAVHDVRRAVLGADDYAVVVGGGPVGVLIALVAQHAGGQVMLVEPDPFRRSVAGQIGLEAVDPQVAIHTHPRPTNLHRFFWRELELLGARHYQRDDMVEAIRLVAAGAIPTTQLISGTLPVHAVEAAFAVLERGGGVMKVLLDWRGSAE